MRMGWIYETDDAGHSSDPSHSMQVTRVAPDWPVRNLMHRRRVVGDRITYVGLDVHKDGIVVALAEDGLRGEVRDYGRIANTPAAALERLVRKLGQERFRYGQDRAVTASNASCRRRARLHCRGAVSDPEAAGRPDQDGSTGRLQLGEAAEERARLFAIALHLDLFAAAGHNNTTRDTSTGLREVSYWNADKKIACQGPVTETPTPFRPIPSC